MIKKKASLKLVPVIQEGFTKLNIDACGPLPITSKGNRYLITAICMSSKFPEAIPVSDISSSNPVERFHRTLKRLLRVLCLDAGSKWDKHLTSILLALRTVSHESTGYTPSELVYGKNLRTPETLVMEHWMEPEEEGDLVTEYMFKLINRLKRCQEVAINKMEEMQVKRKTWYDKNAVKREFKDGDLVLVLATSRANKLAVQWIGPGTVLNKISETNYLVEIPGRRETSQIYHINMLKPYYKRPEHVNVIINDETKNSLADQELEIPYLENNSLVYDFEDVIQASELNKHLHDKQMDRLRELLSKYSKCFSNNPGLTNLVEHEIRLVSDQPVRTKPYRMSHRENEILKNEINRMLKLGIIEVGESDYMSPMILVEVAGKEPRPCIDYRKLNGILRTEYFPLPNIAERVEKVSAAKFITVFDLSKGYWQIPLSKTAQRYAAFCTSFGTYRPLRMSFGLKNAPYFFSKLMAELLNGLEDFVVPYLDDIAIFSDTWESHIKHMETVLQRIKRAKLTIKPSKCKFAQQNVKFLGHIVGQGFRTPSEIKVQAVLEFPTPRTKTQIRAFLGIAGYYQKYINLFSVIAAPLTDALKGRAKKGEIKWTTECENAFRELKGKLIDKPVLYAPNFEREFIVQMDASNAGMGAVLTQLTEQGEEHPILYLSKKFSEVEKRYCTTEKECASIVFAIKSDEAHFWLNGYVKKQNCRIWSEANPQVYVETPLHPEKLTVWCALWAGGIIGPFFKNDEGHNVTVNGDRYRAMITNFFIPELTNHDVQELWFQQDGATCHTTRATIDLLKDTLGDRLISRFGPVNWPPRSCDLTPLDYFLWGYVKSLVYADKPQTLDHLEDNIRSVIADIRLQMLEKVIEIGRPDWTTSEPAVAVLCQKSYLKCNATRLSFE
ncbi:retrovirus-related Pol polyprotein from transposon 297 [Trichonephila clavipes]|nr:retrovirus-related Pol polyprotein from transposon 297 [Trichonephila clavipes]